MDNETKENYKKIIKSLKEQLRYRNKILRNYRHMEDHLSRILSTAQYDGVNDSDFRKTAINHAKEGLENAK